MNKFYFQYELLKTGSVIGITTQCIFPGMPLNWISWLYGSLSPHGNTCKTDIGTLFTGTMCLRLSHLKMSLRDDICHIEKMFLQRDRSSGEVAAQHPDTQEESCFTATICKAFSSRQGYICSGAYKVQVPSPVPLRPNWKILPLPHPLLIIPGAGGTLLSCLKLFLQ